MLHVSCDLCGKVLGPEDDRRFVVKIEVFPAQDPSQITEDDLDLDHMEAVGKMLRALEDNLDEAAEIAPATQHFRFDLCPSCRKKFAADPLGKEADHSLDFSEN